MRSARLRRKTSRALLVVALSSYLLAGSLQGEKLIVTKKVGDIIVDVRFDKNPPLVGKNDVEIEIRDASGKAVPGAKVMIQYYMPPMARMPPMNFKIETKDRKGKYAATLKLIMAGPWIIVLRIVNGEKTRTVKFSIDAR